MPNYHRNDNSGPQLTSMGSTLTFRSLADDFAQLRANAPAGIVDAATTRIGTSEQGKDIHVLRIGKNPAVPVLIAGCHHAREWISVEVPYLIAEYLVNNYASDPLVERIVDARDIWIVPLVNPDGHEETVLNTRLWRKNMAPPPRDSVDPNRNYDTSSWGIAVGAFSTNPADQTYKGPSAGYAAEVVAMQNLITAQQFKGTLDFHSYGRFVLYPWSGQVGAHPDALQNTMGGHVERVIDLHGNNYSLHPASELYTLPPWNRSPQAARVPGGMMDYVVENVPDSIAITVELEPAQSDPRGFVLPESEIQPTFDLLRGAMLTFLNCIGTLRNPPPTRQLILQANVPNQLIVFQQDCSKAFESY